MHFLVIDDHPLVREALRGALLSLRQEAHVAEAADGCAAREALRRVNFDLILLDLCLPDTLGLTLLRELRIQFPATAVAVLSASESRADVALTFDLGAVGFIPKSSPYPLMLRALELILAGGVFVPVQLLDCMTQPAPAHLPEVNPVSFTARQREVLALMMKGQSNKAICRTLDIAEPTVKNHVTAILRVLGARNRTEAVLIAQKLRFETLNEPERRPGV